MFPDFLLCAFCYPSPAVFSKQRDLITARDNRLVSRILPSCIPFQKDMDGGDVPGAIAQKEFYKVTKYNLKDVRATSDVGCLMGF